MTFATAVHILFISFVYPTNVYLSVIHFVAIAILQQPRPTDSADINMRLQLSDTSSIPPMHGGFLLVYAYVNMLRQLSQAYINAHCFATAMR